MGVGFWWVKLLDLSLVPNVTLMECVFFSGVDVNQGASEVNTIYISVALILVF